MEKQSLFISYCWKDGNTYADELEALLGTEYGNSASEIIDFVIARKNVGRKSLYTDSLHSFGKMDGTAIYRIVKQII